MFIYCIKIISMLVATHFQNLAIIIQCLPQKLKCVHASYEELQSMLQLNYDINSIFDSYQDTIHYSNSMKPSETTYLIYFN